MPRNRTSKKSRTKGRKKSKHLKLRYRKRGGDDNGEDLWISPNPKTLKLIIEKTNAFIEEIVALGLNEKTAEMPIARWTLKMYKEYDLSGNELLYVGRMVKQMFLKAIGKYDTQLDSTSIFGIGPN